MLLRKGKYSFEYVLKEFCVNYQPEPCNGKKEILYSKLLNDARYSIQIDEDNSTLKIISLV